MNESFWTSDATAVTMVMKACSVKTSSYLLPDYRKPTKKLSLSSIFGHRGSFFKRLLTLA